MLRGAAVAGVACAEADGTESGTTCAETSPAATSVATMTVSAANSFRLTRIHPEPGSDGPDRVGPARSYIAPRPLTIRMRTNQPPWSSAETLELSDRHRDLLVLSIDPLGQGYYREQARALYRDILEDVVALPGVESASWARRAPLSPGPNRGNVFTLDGGTAPEPDVVRVSLNYVDSGFFDTVDIPVLRGRGFREEDPGTT